MTGNRANYDLEDIRRNDVDFWVQEFCKRTGMPEIDYELIDRLGEPILVFYLGNPGERFFRIIEEISKTYSPSELFPLRATIKKRAPNNYLLSKEVQYLIKEISGSLTVNRYSYAGDYFQRYIKSGHGAEQVIQSDNNIVIFGRRGSGKSSLLLFDMHARAQKGRPYAWVDMQAYPQRNDNGVIVDVLFEVLQQTKDFGIDKEGLDALLSLLSELDKKSDVAFDDIKRILPKIKRYFQEINKKMHDFVIYLDDFHLITLGLQPLILTALYSFARGNKIYIKLSAIEAFSKLWNPVTRDGFEIPHDAQSFHLDYNLTKSEKAKEHIVNILEMHSVFCGLPSIKVLCNDNDVLTRLVWVSAGIPRDALNIFSQALTKAINNKRRQLAVSDVNAAASERVKDKLKDIKIDNVDKEVGLTKLLKKVRTICIKENNLNAFLVEIDNDSDFYQNIMELVGLRLLHVINEGITPNDAGRKYIALILDYGFYISVRSGRSVKLFNRELRMPTYKELRTLPVLHSPTV